MATLRQFWQYASGTHADNIKRLRDVPAFWPLLTVSLRASLAVAALFMCVVCPVAAWIAVGLAGCLGFLLFRALLRITLGDMGSPSWRPRSVRRLVLLVFVNLLEVVTLAGVLLGAVESIHPGSFASGMASAGACWLAAAAPLGGAGALPVTGLAESAVVFGFIVVLFMLVVVIAVAVGGASRSRNRAVSPDPV